MKTTRLMVFKRPGLYYLPSSKSVRTFHLNIFLSLSLSMSQRGLCCQYFLSPSSHSWLLAYSADMGSSSRPAWKYPRESTAFWEQLTVRRPFRKAMTMRSLVSSIPLRNESHDRSCTISQHSPLNLRTRLHSA